LTEETITETRAILPRISQNKREKIKKFIPRTLYRSLWLLYEILRGRGKHAIQIKQRVEHPFPPVFDNSAVIAMIDSVPFWWHTIRFGDSLTPGETAERTHVWKTMAFPPSLSGKSVLDIGAWDGYYSFEAERRGADKVVAVEFDPGHVSGFKVGKRIIGSDVDYFILDVHVVDCIRMSFDVINWMGNYYHLREPVPTLEKIFSKLNSGGLLIIEGHVLIDGSRVRKLPPDESHNHSRFLFSVEEIEEQCRLCGFRSTEVVSTIGNRALLRAYK
jgi:SAM-dependent methyltransferase